MPTAPRRRLLASVLLFAVAGAIAPARAIELVVDVDTGEAFFKNPSPLVSESLDGYTITSDDSGLIVGNWTTIAGNYDLSGDQSVDALADWFVISGTSDSLTEVSTVSLSGSLGPGQVVPLGEIWDPASEAAISVTTSAGVDTTDFVAEFRSLVGDYNGDLLIDSFDFITFNQDFGSTTELGADGNGNGVVDAPDYTIWRDAYQASLLALPAAAPPALSVPEPTAVRLMALAGLALASRRR